jgi:hypothetical protein
MKRALELVEPLPPTIEDCFAEFDKVFDSLADELEWKDAEPIVRANDVDGTAAAAPPSAPIALVPPKPVPTPPVPSAPEPADDVLDEYERAFSALDDKLAESDDKFAASSGSTVTALVERPVRPRTPARAAVTKLTPARVPGNAMKPKRQRRAMRTFEDVFGVLENLSIVRRRGRLLEERHLIARLLDDARQLCADLDLQSARVRVEFAVLTLENNHFDKLGSEIDELARHIRHDLRFCSIAPGRKADSR